MGAKRTPWASDRELVDQILAGSREHFELLYDAYFGRVYGFALKRLGDPGEAEDVAQETLLQFLRDYRAHRYDRDKGRLRGWIAGIARHRVIDYQRKRGRRRERAGEVTALLEIPDDSGIAELWDQELERSILRQSVEELRRNTRTSEKSIRAFEMILFEQQTVEAVAEDLGMKTHDVYVARSRVTAKLREIAERLRSLYEVDP